MRKIYFLLLTVLFAAIANAQVSVTATAGTVGPTPYTNLSSAFTAINAGTHQGVITVDISASFTDAAVAVLNSSGAGSASYTSVLVRPSADGVVISFASATGRGVIELNGADNVTIDGDNPNTGGTNRNLTITNTAANTITFTSCIRTATSTLITNCDNVTIKNCNLNASGTGRNTAAFIAEVTTWGIIASAGASTAAVTTAPSALASATTTMAAGQTVTNLLIDNNNIQVAARGISVNGAATTNASGLLVSNNIVGNATAGVVDQVTAVGITVQGTSNGIVRGNTVRLEGFIESSTPNRAINVGMVSTAGVTGVTIEKNIVERSINSDGGSWPTTGIDISGGNNHIIQNNFVGNCLNSQVAGTGAFSTTFGCFGIRINAGTGHKIYHNSVSFTGVLPGSVSTDLCATLCIVSATSTGMDIRNNIFSNRATGGNPTPYNTVFTCVFVPSITAMTLTLNNNAYFQGTTAYSGIGQVSATGSAANLYLAANFNAAATSPATNWRSVSSAIGTATNDNASYGLSSAPPFVSVTDLHIPAATATPLESSGAAIGVTSDIDGDVRNATTPDMGADEFAGVYVDLVAPNITYTNLASTCLTTDRTLTGVVITDASGVPTTGTLRPRIYYRKNAGAYFSQPGTLTSGTGINGTWSFNIINSDMGGVATNDIISYYIIAQDIASPANISSNPSGVVATDVNTITTPPSTPNTYGIGGTLVGTYTVGIGGNYTTLTSAVAAYNIACLAGPVIFNLTDATYPSETFPITIQNNALASVVNTLTIKPAASVTSVISGSATTALIRDLGSYVTVDGSNNGSTSRNLTITNTSVTTPSVYLIGSTGTTPIIGSGIKNTILINGVNTSSAVVITDAVTLGNPGYFNNITIQNNSIQKAYIGLYCNAAIVAGNGSVNIVSNDVSTSGANAIRLCGLYVQGTDGATISQNTVGNFETTSAENDVAIWMATGAGNTTVSGNTVSNLAYTGTGAQAPYGIRESTGLAASGNNITGNTVTNITTTGGTTVFGIDNSSGGTIIQKNIVTTVKNNNTGTFGAYGIDVSAGNNVTIRNNFVSDVNHDMTGGAAFSTTFGVFGIRIQAGTGHKVYHNSVNLYGLMPGIATTSLLTAAFTLVSTASTGCDVRNNIFVNNITGGTTSIAHVSVSLPSGGTSAMNLTWNNNAYYYGTDVARQGVGQAGTTAGTNFYTSLAALTAYTSTLAPGGTNDNASLASTAAVPYISGTDLHINNAVGLNWCLNGTGANVAVTDDIDNQARNNPPDIGADEFTPVSDNAATPPSQTIACGTAITPITFSGTGVSFNWTRNNTVAVTGIAASGSGSISGTLTNTTAAPVTVTFTIVPINAGGCAGAAFTATVTVNPTPDAVATPSSQTSCSGSPITTIVLSSNTVGATTYNWTRDNTVAVTGIASSGSGNISGALTNTTAAPVLVTFTITPVAGGCSGLPITATVSVNPLPQVPGVITQPTTCVSVDGAINITPGGTPGPYTYFWSTSGGSGVNPTAEDQTGLTVGVYNVLVTDQTTGCQQTASFALTGPGGCDICPTMGALTTTPSGAACPLTNVGMNVTGLTSMGNTYGIIFKYYAAPVVDSYTGGTVIATIPNGSLGGGGTTASTSTSFATAGNYVIYTILSPTPVDPLCRPSAQVNLTINPTPNAIATPSAQTICSGGTITTIALSGGVPLTTFNWTRNNTVAVTGIAASGSGNISGALTNTTSAPVTVTFTITPTANGCPGTAVTATVIVNPTPNAVATPASQTACSGTPITTIVLSSAVTGTTYTWTRNNTVTVTGIAASGSGNISGTLTNTTTAPITVTFTITPTANGCPGAPITATVVVNPTPNISTGSMQVIITGNGFFADEITWTLTNSVGTVILSGGPYGFSPPPTPSAIVPATNAPFSFFIEAQGTFNDNSCLWEVRCDGNVVASGCIRGTGSGATCANTGTLTVPNISGCGSNLGPQTICSGSAITPIVPVGSLPGTTFNWTRNNTVTVTGIPASGTGTISGTLTNTTSAPVVVTFTITPVLNGCNGTPANVNVTVNPTPNAVATPAAQTICTGTAITPIVLSGAVSGTTYTWTRNNTATVTGIPASGSGNISGTLTNTTVLPVTVTFTITPTANGCPGTPITATVTVNQALTISCPGNITVPSVVGGCTAVVTYAPVVVGTPVPTLTYSLSGATTGSGNGTGSGLPFNVGVTTVTLTATNICGVVSCSFTITVTDSQLPVISTQPVNRTVCTGSSATFSVVSSNVVTYQWQQWNGTIWVNVAGATAANFTLNNVAFSQNTNTFRVIINGLCTIVISNPASLYVNALPSITLATSRIPILLPTESVTITATSIPTGGIYTWFKNGVAVPGVTGPVLVGLTVDDAGTYHVRYTDQNGCISTSGDIVVSAAASGNLLVYPNPSDGRFHVRFYNQANEEVTLSVYDAKGARVYYQTYGTSTPYTRMDVDISKSPAGVYLVEIRNAKGEQVGARRIILGH